MMLVCMAPGESRAMSGRWASGKPVAGLGAGELGEPGEPQLRFGCPTWRHLFQCFRFSELRMDFANCLLHLLLDPLCT